MLTLKYTLYGDGIHDDYPAIQELIDSGKCEVSLPAPKVRYMISKTLTIPSYFKLTLPRYAEIKLMDGANCFMVSNKLVAKFELRLPDWVDDEARQAWNFVNDYSPEDADCCHDFEIEGGIWNFNNKNQRENPIWTHLYDEENYKGYGMFFYNVKNFRLSNMTLKDPVNFAVTIDRASYFTVENIDFDFNYGNPTAVNMDGIHLDGNCHFGYIRNLKGRCFDDLVALNAREGSTGPITNIEIDGIYAEDCHSAVRLLSVAEKVEKIHISNVYGTYYQYCIALSKFFPGKTEQGYDMISIDHIYASKAERRSIYWKDGSYVFPLIWVQNDSLVKNLSIECVHRREYNIPIETVHVGEDTPVENLILRDITVENHTGEPFPVFRNWGKVKHLHLEDIRTDGDEIWCNTPSGSVEEVWEKDKE